jgi:elongation factor G
MWKDHKINLMDCPGGAEAVGDGYPALRAADIAVFVVDATAGVQAQHDQLWAACEAIGMPRLVFLNKLDREGAAFQRNIDALRERYGKPLAPVEMPIGVEKDFHGVIDLLHFNAVEIIDGKRVEEDVPAERLEQAQRNRDYLIEAIVENDDSLLERYLEGEVPEAKELIKVFSSGFASGGFLPVLIGSAAMDMGTQMLADFLVEEAPGPQVEDGPPAFYVFKTISDPYVGHINLLRSLRGNLRADDHLIVSRTGADVRLHQLISLNGRDQTSINEIAAGDIGAVGKLDDVRTGDVLHAKDAPMVVEPVPMPQPYHRTAIVAASSGDEDKLSTALARLVEEDPSLRVERPAETNQLILRGFGPGHIDVALARLQRKFGVAVEQVPVRISYREALKGRAEGFGRHVKQSGGHGQYGVATITVEPLPRGEGFQFEDAIVGGVIPNQFIPSVEKGIREAMAKGVLAGYPVVDVKARLHDGKHHSVDSSQVAFELAGSLAFRDAADKAGVSLLEPIVELVVTVPDAFTGDIMGDVSARRGRIQGTEPSEVPGRTVITALVPEAELRSYTAELRSITSGAGTFSMRYSHHDEVPDHIAKKIVAEAKA